MCCHDNSIDWVGIIQAAAGLLAIIVAVVALIVSWETEKRSNNRFISDQRLSERIAVANVKPIISTWTVKYTNLKGVKLVNCGTGTAIIIEINFIKGERRVKNIAKLFNLGREIIWDTYWTFTESKCNLQAGQIIKLVELSLKNLTNQNIPEQEAKNILDRWQAELEGIIIEIKYQDVFDNRQADFNRTLHS